MTDRELMQQALAVLQKHVDYYDYEHFTSVCELEPAKDLILALRERLAQPQRTHWEGCEDVHPECRKPEQWQGLAADSTIQTVPAQGGLLPAQQGEEHMSKEAMKLALEALIGARAFLESDAPVEIWGVNDKSITAIKEALAQPEQREVEIEFKEWMHPQIGVVPVDSKTPLILKAHIREKNA